MTSSLLLSIGLWILNVMCLTGQILVAKYNRLGVILWIIADTMWAIYDFRVHQYEQASLWVAYTIISIWQYYSWSKNSKKEKK